MSGKRKFRPADILRAQTSIKRPRQQQKLSLLPPTKPSSHQTSSQTTVIPDSSSSLPLHGLIISSTGVFSSDSDRQKTRAVIERLGGTLDDDFDPGRCNILLARHLRSSKAEAAQASGIPIVKVSWFREVCKHRVKIPLEDHLLLPEDENDTLPTKLETSDPPETHKISWPCPIDAAAEDPAANARALLTVAHSLLKSPEARALLSIALLEYSGDPRTGFPRITKK